MCSSDLHHFRFGIAHATVVFDHHRLTFDLNQSEEDKSFVVDAFGAQPIDRRTDDALKSVLPASAKYFSAMMVRRLWKML